MPDWAFGENEAGRDLRQGCVPNNDIRHAGIKNSTEVILSPSSDFMVMIGTGITRDEKSAQCQMMELCTAPIGALLERM